MPRTNRPLTLLVVLLAAVAGAMTTSARADDGAAAFKGQTVLVTGANRGLGLEFCRQLHAAGATVIGTARNPDEATELKALGVRVEPLDVTDQASVDALAKSIGDGAIDVLINNAGIGGAGRTLEDVDIERVRRTIDVNYLGPLRVTKALLPALKRGEQKLVVSISSGLGSIEGNTSGSHYGYRESKAALNMFMRTIAAELKGDGFICLAMSPGWVRTDMGGPSATLSPAESIGGMLTVLAEVEHDRSGSFLHHTGDIVAW